MKEELFNKEDSHDDVEEIVEEAVEEVVEESNNNNSGTLVKKRGKWVRV